MPKFKPVTDADAVTFINNELIPFLAKLKGNGSSAGGNPGQDGSDGSSAVDWNLGVFGDPMGHWIHGATPLTDLSGLGNDLVVSSGASILAQSIDGENLGRHIPTSWILESPSADFRLTGAMSISCVIRLVDPTVYGVIAACEGPGATSVSNSLFDFGLSSGGVYFGQENGVKTSVGPGPGPNYFGVVPSCGEAVMLTVTRDAQATGLRLYAGKMNIADGTMDAGPADGSSSLLRLFADGTSTNDLANCYVYATSVFPFELAASDVAALCDFRLRL